MNQVNAQYKPIVRFARANGFLSPLWLTPNSSATVVNTAFSELEDFLHNAYIQGELGFATLEDIDGFLWQLKKEFAYGGWEAIAPYLLANREHHKFSLADVGL